MLEIMVVFTIVLLMISLFFQFSQMNTQKIAFEFTTNQMESYISEVEEAGYMTLSTKALILKDLNGKYATIDVEGTSEKVNKGQQVDLIVKVENMNALGMTLYRKTFIKQGIAK